MNGMDAKCCREVFGARNKANGPNRRRAIQFFTGDHVNMPWTTQQLRARALGNSTRFFCKVMVSNQSQLKQALIKIGLIKH
jgi:hypothetical protein